MNNSSKKKRNLFKYDKNKNIGKIISYISDNFLEIIWFLLFILLVMIIFFN